MGTKDKSWIVALSFLALPWLCVEGRYGSSLPPWVLHEPWLPRAVGQGLMHGCLQEVPWEQLWNHSALVWCMRNKKIPFLHSLCSVLLLHSRSSQFFESHREHQSDLHSGHKQCMCWGSYVQGPKPKLIIKENCVRTNDVWILKNNYCLWDPPFHFVN